MHDGDDVDDDGKTSRVLLWTPLPAAMKVGGCCVEPMGRNQSQCTQTRLVTCGV